MFSQDTPTSNSVAERIQALNSMIQDGRILEAMSEFYADDVSMQENEAPPTVGKPENIAREKDFIANVTEWRAAIVKGLAIGPDITMVEWHLDFTHKEWGVRKFDQVAVQRWKNGKIISERFYYGE